MLMPGLPHPDRMVGGVRQNFLATSWHGLQKAAMVKMVVNGKDFITIPGPLMKEA